MLNFFIIWNRLFQIFLVWCIGTICPNLNFDKYRWADLIWLLFLLLLLLYNPNVNVDRWWAWSKSNWTRQREMSRAMACQPQTHTANIQMKLLFFFVFSFFICPQISRCPSRPLPLDEWIQASLLYSSTTIPIPNPPGPHLFYLEILASLALHWAGIQWLHYLIDLVPVRDTTFCLDILFF